MSTCTITLQFVDVRRGESANVCRMAFSKASGELEQKVTGRVLCPKDTKTVFSSVIVLIVDAKSTMRVFKVRICTNIDQERAI